MRSVTPSEATVIRSLLAAEQVSERDRISRSGIPPRTFRDIRSRLYAEGWLADRYLPDPVLLDRPFVSFLLAEPYLERMGAVVDTWSSDPEVTHLCRSPQGIFAVRLRSKPGTELPGIRDISDGKAMHRLVSMTIDCRRNPIPIYFDFEAAWTRLRGLNGTLSYPHGWSSRIGREGPGEMSPSARSAFGALVRRPFEIEAHGRSPILTAPFFLPPSQRRVLDRGWVSRRVFLEPTKLSNMNGHKVDQLVFLHGTLLPGADANNLLDGLISECRMTPFLYAFDGSRVLIGSMSPAPPDVQGSQAPRASVSGMLRAHLEGIEVFRESLAQISAPIWHRYDRSLQGL